MRDARVSLLLVTFLTGCSSEGDGAGRVDPPSAAGGASSSAAGGATSGVPDAASEDGSPLPGPDGVCAPGCAVAADCCPVGIDGCPGEYPNAWECVSGVCKAGGCRDTSQCRPGGDFERFSCHAVAGVGSCFEPCEDDAACAAIPDSTCTGLADDGARFCKVAARCSDDSACAGYGQCDLVSGECRCDLDSECRALPGLVCARPGQP